MTKLQKWQNWQVAKTKGRLTQEESKRHTGMGLVQRCIAS
jgi:hypothetical protein